MNEMPPKSPKSPKGSAGKGKKKGKKAETPSPEEVEKSEPPEDVTGTSVTPEPTGLGETEEEANVDDVSTAKQTEQPPAPLETPSESEVRKTPEPKDWISLGSELEIDEESAKQTREKLCFKFSRVRRRPGQPACFSDRKYATLGWDPYQDSRFSIKQIERDCGVQAVQPLQSRSVQTQWRCQRNMFTQYTPRDLSEEDKENLLNSEGVKDFCNSVNLMMLKALQQEEIANVFCDYWRTLGPEVGEGPGKATEDLVLYQSFTDPNYTRDKKISCINWHPTIFGVIAVALTEKKEEQESDDSAAPAVRPSVIVFFCFSNPSEPQLLLECPDDIFTFQFCPSDPNIIVGGCVNGQVVLWDISSLVFQLHGTPSRGKKDSLQQTDAFDPGDNKEGTIPMVPYCAVSAVETSHRAPISDVQWLPPTFQVTRTGIALANKHKTSVQVVTCSPDGSAMFWDLRPQKIMKKPALEKQAGDEKTQLNPYRVPDTFKHLDRTWKPLYKISVPKMDTSGDYAPLLFNFQPYTPDGHIEKHTVGVGDDGNPSDGGRDYSQLRMPSAKSSVHLEDVNTKLYFGTEDGEIVYTDWKLEECSKPLHAFRIHHWLVNTIQRSPFFKDIVLTAGGWNFAILKEGVLAGPIVVSEYTEEVCAAGCWSLSRPAVFFIGKEDGSIEVWNLLEKTSEPVQIYAHVTSGKITRITPWTASPKQHLLAVTDDIGVIRVFEIPKVFNVPSRNESLIVRKYFEQEESRLTDYFKRKEQWEVEKREEENLRKNMESARPVKEQPNDEDEHMWQYREYLSLEEEILKSRGLWLEPEEHE